MTGKKYHPTKDKIRRLISRCEDSHECPGTFANTKVLCRLNCPVVRDCIREFGVDLITIGGSDE